MPEVEQQLVEAFKAHLDVEGANLEKMVNNFLSFLRWKPFTLYDRKKDLEALDRFILGLSHLDKRVYDSLSISARKRLDSRLGLGADYSDEGILDFMQRSEERHVRLFMDLLAHASELRTLVAAARKDIEVSERNAPNAQRDQCGQTSCSGSGSASLGGAKQTGLAGQRHQGNSRAGKVPCSAFWYSGDRYVSDEGI